MVGTTLTDVRRHIEDLATEDGDYYLVCGRTGDRPVPAADLRFESRTVARAAVRATEQYRAALRRYDPRLPYYDLVVCADVGPPGQHDPAPARADGTAERGVPDPVLDGAADAPAHRPLAEFCHRVAAAVFETLSARDDDGVERAVMDAYVAHAERVADPDDLCLCLLESVAAQLDARLDPREQTAVLAGAAGRLSPAAADANPVAAALGTLRDRHVLGAYTCAPVAVDRQGDRRTVVGEVTGYALSPQDGRLPVLPLVVELFRHRPDRPPAALRAAAVADGWRLTVELAADADPDGLAAAPIDAEG